MHVLSHYAGWIGIALAGITWFVLSQLDAKEKINWIISVDQLERERAEREQLKNVRVINE